MADVFSKEKRSQVMSAIRSKDTAPELQLRKALHAKGYRYSLHSKHLPGTPDLVFRKFQAVLFVNGCFWHGHNCSMFKFPSTNQEFWKNKILTNQERDSKVHALLTKSGWRILTVWECSLRGKSKLNFDNLIITIEDWLNSENQFCEISSFVCKPNSMH